MAIFAKKGDGSTESSATSSSAESSAPSVDVLAAQLDGETIPEKFRGKTVQELLQIYSDTDRKRTFAEQEAQQWRAIAESSGNTNQSQSQSDYFDEDAAKAVSGEIQKAISPIVDAFGRMQKDYLRETRDDFNQFEKRTDEIFAGMKPEHKVHPDYGYTFAYRLARAEADDERVVQKKKAPPPPAPSTGGTSKKKDELTLLQKKHMEMMGMDEERYRKYMTVHDPLGGSNE